MIRAQAAQSVLADWANRRCRLGLLLGRFLRRLPQQFPAFFLYRQFNTSKVLIGSSDKLVDAAL